MVDTFMNDNYRLLKLMYDSQIILLNKKFVPLTQVEMAGVLGFSKMKVNAIFIDLQEKGYITKISRGKYSLSDMSETIIKSIESIEEKEKNESH